MSATTNLGKVSVTPKGAWASTNTYEILDIVTSGGSSYLAKQDVPTGVPLTNTSYWIMIAEKGDGGEVTSASASISGGYGTPGVTVTAGGTAHERTLAFAFTNLRGEKGETGNGIDSVYKTGTSGLVDTYTILFTDGSTYEFEVNNGTASIDDTLTKSGWAADAKAVGDTKASIDGFYETMGVGVADNLTPYSEDSGASQDIPFIAQGTGCGNGESVVDTGSYCQLKKKLGNTVGVNQQWDESKIPSDSALYGTNTYTANGVTFTKNGDGSISVQTVGGGATSDTSVKIATQTTMPLGQKHLIRGAFGGSSSTYFIEYAGTNRATNGSIFDAYPGGYNMWLVVKSGAVLTTAVKVTPQVIFLPLWFGSNDRIPSDLLSHPENWGRYYAGSLAYAAGYLDSADGTVLKSIGRQIWDGEHDVTAIPNQAYYCKGTATITYKDRGGNTISTASVTNTSFTTPADCFSFGVSGTGVTISLYYSGESGYDEDYDYTVLASVDTGSEVLRSAGAVADEKTPDGTITRRVGYVDMGTLNWSAISNNRFETSSPISGAKYYPSITAPNIRCSRYQTVTFKTIYETSTDMCISIWNEAAYIQVRDTSYSTAAAFKTAMSGVYLYYELATPTTEQGTAFAENIPCDDFGSMYWTQTKGIPQGNEIFYPVDYKASIDTLYNRVEGDMSAIVIDSQLEVVADRIPEAPSEDGTYTLKATVSSGTKTYSWVADE